MIGKLPRIGLVVASVFIATSSVFAQQQDNQQPYWKGMGLRKGEAWQPEMNSSAYSRQWQRQHERQYERDAQANSGAAKANWLDKRKAQIQAFARAGEYDHVADVYFDIAQAEQLGSFGSYGQDMPLLTCYKNATQAWLQQINKCARERDNSGLYTAWQKIRGPLASVQAAEPNEPQWCYLLGKAEFNSRLIDQVSVHGVVEAKQWLNKCMAMPQATPYMKSDCQRMIATMNNDVRRSYEEEKADLAAFAEYCRTHPVTRADPYMIGEPGPHTVIDGQVYHSSPDRAEWKPGY
jgi:hypothetical protein